MDTDYRALCIELFGTDDEQELRELAKKLTDNRNAGRKKKFNKNEIAEICALLNAGVSIVEVARRYRTTRQTIYKLVNEIQEGSTMQIRYMYKNRLCTIINVDFAHETVGVVNLTEDVLHRAFGAVAQPTWQQFMDFLAERCFPATRANAKALLKALGLTAYDPLQIVEKTAGRMAEDDLWMQFRYHSVKEAIS